MQQHTQSIVLRFARVASLVQGVEHAVGSKYAMNNITAAHLSGPLNTMFV